MTSPEDTEHLRDQSTLEITLDVFHDVIQCFSAQQVPWVDVGPQMVVVLKGKSFKFASLDQSLEQKKEYWPGPETTCSRN